MLFGWLSGSGQIRPHNIELGSRSFNLDGMDFFGAASPQGFFLADVRAAELKSKFSQNVSIVSLNAYSPVIASHDNKVAEEFYNRTNSILKGQYPINIAFISSVQPEMQNYRGRVSFNLPKDYFSQGCISKLKDIEDLMSAKFNERCSYAFGYQIFEAIAATLEDLNKILDSGCNITPQDEEAIYRAKGYKVFDIPSKPIIGTFGARQVENSKRSCPIVIDSSRAFIAEKSLPNYFFEGSDWMTLSARYVFTSGFIPLSTRVHLESTMLSDKSCDLGVHVHISNSEYGKPLEKVYLKIFVLDEGYFGGLYTSNPKKGSIDFLRSQFDFGIYNNDNVTEWIFQFKNHKELIKSYIFNDAKYVDPLNNEVIAGFICGFADSILKDMQFLANITILQQSVKDANWAFSHYAPQVFIGNGDQANAELAFRTYIKEVIKSSDVGSFGNDFNDVKQAITIFYELIQDGLKDKWDEIYFKQGTFESGYAAGETVYVALGLRAIVVGAGKGILALSKGAHQSMLNVSKSLKGNLSQEKILAALDDHIVDLSKLYAKLGSRTHLKAWFVNGMPPWVKMRIASMPDDALDFFENAIQKHPNLKNEWIATPKMFDFAEALHRDRWAKYGLGGLSLRTQGGITSEMRKLIGDVEVNTNGIKTKVKTFNIGDETAGTIGRAFDDEIVFRLKESWRSGDFSNFPPSVRNTLSNIHSDPGGFKLVINEPRLSINGQNFDPDILFVKVTDDGLGNITTDIKYIDVKYLDDVPFNSGGQSAIKAAVSANGNTTVVNTTGLNLTDALSNLGIPSTAGNLTITSVEKLSVKVSDLGLIIN